MTNDQTQAGPANAIIEAALSPIGLFQIYVVGFASLAASAQLIGAMVWRYFLQQPATAVKAVIACVESWWASRLARVAGVSDDKCGELERLGVLAPRELPSGRRQSTARGLRGAEREATLLRDVDMLAQGSRPPARPSSGSRRETHRSLGASGVAAEADPQPPRVALFGAGGGRRAQGGGLGKWAALSGACGGCSGRPGFLQSGNPLEPRHVVLRK